MTPDEPSERVIELLNRMDQRVKYPGCEACGENGWRYPKDVSPMGAMEALIIVCANCGLVRMFVTAMLDRPDEPDVLGGRDH